jgi:hypothetical protein
VNILLATDGATWRKFLCLWHPDKTSHLLYLSMGKLAVIKTKETELSVDEFIANLPDEQKRKDCLTLLKLMQKATKEKPKLWSNSTVGFGLKRYQSPASGREVEWYRMGFSPRKSNITVYFVNDLQTHAAALNKLGKHKAGGGCLYINKLADVDMNVLEEMIRVSGAKK